MLLKMFNTFLIRLSFPLSLICFPAGTPLFSAIPDCPTGLLCELSNKPLGIEDVTPEFGWIVRDHDQNETQTAYQVLVASSKQALSNNQGDLWDSGKTYSGESTNVSYAGKALQPASVYYWKVRTWDKDNQVSPYSQPQMVVTAVKDNWSALPVWSSSGSYALIRKEVTLPSKQIQKAIAYVTGRNTYSSRQYVYRFYINGALAGIGPARGFNNRVPYNTFDVTHYLNSGNANVLAAACYSFDSEKDFLLQLKIFYYDGTTSEIITNNTWKAINADNIYNTNDYFSGYYKAGPEHIDARNYPFGWNNTGFNDSAWNNAVTKSTYTNLLFAQPMRNMEVVEQAPATVIDKGNGNWFVDFGKEICAGMQLTISGSDGDTINVRLGEELSAPNTVRYNARTGVSYDETWTLAAGTKTISNFGYRGFRYAEITGPADMALDPSHIKALVVRYPFNDYASYFTSTSPVLNEIWRLCKYSIKATNLDIYQDCPTRERGPYEGDAYINQLSHYAVDRDFTLARYSGEYLYYNPTWPTEYKQTSILEAWADYMATGNRDSLQTYYSVLKTKTLENAMNGDNLVEKSTDNDLVDWPDAYRDKFAFTTINTVINAWNYQALRGLASIAGVLHFTDDQTIYSRKADAVQSAMNSKLFRTDRYVDGQNSTHASNHANFFPLAFNLPTDTIRKSVADYIKCKGMLCSVYGAQYLLEALYNADEGGYALKLLTSQKTNSWYHMIHDLNATIVTEAWDPAGKSNMSFAHAWGSAPANIIPRRLFGIEPVEAGYKKIAVKPQTADLERGIISTPTIKGNIIVAVTKDSWYTIMIYIPANTSAKVYVPMMGTEGTEVIVDGSIANGTESNGYIVFDNIGSGFHSFMRKVTEPEPGPQPDPSLTETPRIHAAASSVVNSSWEAVNIIDGDAQSGWSSADTGGASGTEQWIAIDLGDIYAVKEVKLLPRTSDAFYCFPTAFTFQYSIDGFNWLDVENQSYMNYPDPFGEEQYFIFDSAVEAAYLRLHITGFKADQYGVYYSQLAEMYAYTADEIAAFYLFRDDFSRDMSKWSAVSNAGIEDERLLMDLHSYIESAFGAGWTDYTLECDTTIIENALGITFRVNDDQNYYMWQLNAAQDVIRMHTQVDGTWTVIKEVPYTFDLNTDYHVKIDAIGSAISISIDGSVIDTMTDTTFTKGSIGFRQGWTEKAFVDNVVVYR